LTGLVRSLSTDQDHHHHHQQQQQQGLATGERDGTTTGEATTTTMEGGQCGAATGAVVHDRIICDGCGMEPIVGVRYKVEKCLVGGLALCSGCSRPANPKG